MNIHFEFTHHRSTDVSSSCFSSADEFKKCLDVLLEEDLWYPPFDSAGIRILDENGVVLCEVSLARVPTQDKLYDVAISLNVGSDTIRIARFTESIYNIWYYFGSCAAPYSPPDPVDYVSLYP